MSAWTYYPELLSTPVPRYTSYPTAAEFSDAIGSGQLEAAFAGLEPGEPVSLYVHIPYCQEICWYCGCNTGAANKTHRLSSYLDALHEEIDLIAARIGGRARVKRISFGGGSPNAIAPEEFARLLARLRGAFSAANALVSIELDPRSLTPAWFDAIGAAGISRASLGVQTLDPKVQRAIGRIQPEKLIRTAAEELRRAGVRSLNFDLMYGLPYQGLKELEETLDTAIEMLPERIALFGYAHVPHLIARQRRIDGGALPDPAVRFSQAELGHRNLTRAGYDAVGFDHYARPHDPLALAARQGGLRRNFQGFTDDESEVLVGLGASAITQFPDLIVQNEKKAGAYRDRIEAGELAGAHGIERNRGDRQRGWLIERLLCDGEAEIRDHADAGLMTMLQPFLAKGLATVERGRLRLPDYGRPYARVMASLFDGYRHPEGRRFSSAI